MTSALRGQSLLAHERRIDGRNSPARQLSTLDVGTQAYRQTNPLKPHNNRRQSHQAYISRKRKKLADFSFLLETWEAADGFISPAGDIPTQPLKTAQLLETWEAADGFLPATAGNSLRRLYACAWVD